MGNEPHYELVASDIVDTNFVYEAPDLNTLEQITLKITAVRTDGRESDEGTTVIRLLP